MKRKIVELVIIHKKGGGISSNTLDMTLLGFRDCNTIGGSRNEIFPLVITATVVHFDVSWILIKGGSLYDIMYSKMFENMTLEKWNMWSYEGSDLLAFNGKKTRLWGVCWIGDIYRRKKERLNCELTSHCCPLQECYNSILDRPFVASLDAMASTIHLKIYNLHGKHVTLMLIVKEPKWYIKHFRRTKERGKHANQCSIPNRLAQKHEHPTSQKWLIRLGIEHGE